MSRLECSSRDGLNRNNAPFLFVNKGQTSETLSRSSRDETSFINSHSQLWRSERIGRQGTSAVVAIGMKSKNAILFCPSTATKNYDWCVQPNKPIRRKKPERLRSTSVTAARVASPGWKLTKLKRQIWPTHTGSESREEMDRDLADAVRNEASLANVQPTCLHYTHPQDDQIMQANFCRGDCIDPFSVTAIPIDAPVQLLLQYYLALSSPPAFKDEPLPEDHAEDQSPFVSPPSLNLREVVRGALFNKMHMYALLTAAASRMKHVSMVDLPKDCSAEIFMQKAIPRLRVYLISYTDTVVDKQVVMDIFFLCVCEWYFQNYDAALMHLRAVGHLMESLDLSQDFDHFIHETACYNDVFIATETSTPPLFPLTWDAHPLTTVRWASIHRELVSFGDCYRMGSGFTDVLSQHNFSPAMATIFTNFLLWADMAQYTGICRPATGADTHWLDRKGQALLHRLLSIPAISPVGTTVAPLRRKEECCRFVLIILLSCRGTQIAWRSGMMNIARLKKSLGGIDRDWSSHSLNQMLLWVLMFGAFAANGTADEEWFLGRALQVTRMLDLGDYEQIRGVIGRFFYLNKLQGGSVRKLAEWLNDEVAEAAKSS